MEVTETAGGEAGEPGLQRKVSVRKDVNYDVSALKENESGTNLLK